MPTVTLTRRVEKHAVVAKEEAEKPRAGQTVEVPAHGVGDEAAAAATGKIGKHPDSLDVDRLAADVLRTVAKFEEEEELAAAARG